MNDPMSAQDQRDQLKQAQQGSDPSYSGGTGNVLQPGKTGSVDDAAGGQEAALNLGDDAYMEEQGQADYGSAGRQPQDEGGMNDDQNSPSALGGMGGQHSNSDPQMTQDEEGMFDDEADGADVSSAGGGM